VRKDFSDGYVLHLSLVDNSCENQERAIRLVRKYVHREYAKLCPQFNLCLQASTTQYNLMSRQSQDRLYVTASTDEAVEAFANEEWDVFASTMIGWSDPSIRKYYEGPYDIGNKPYSRESQALVSRENDVVFSKEVSRFGCECYFVQTRITSLKLTLYSSCLYPSNNYSNCLISLVVWE